MNAISEFCRRMRESLQRRERATSDEDRKAAEDDMVDLMRGNSRTAGESGRDFKKAQSGER